MLRQVGSGQWGRFENRLKLMIFLDNKIQGLKVLRFFSTQEIVWCRIESRPRNFLENEATFMVGDS